MGDCYGVAIAVVGAVACVVLVGCRPGSASRPLVVVASGGTDGWIVPCGCTSNQSGGLPRRATYITELRRDAEVLLVDVGGAAHGTSPYDLAKFEAILRGEALMGVTAHNVGAVEARFGPSELYRLGETLSTPMLSTNACDSSGRLVAEPIRVVSTAGRRVAVLGVLSESYATAAIRVKPPRQAVLETLRGAAGKYDAVIVLAYLPEEELKQFADALPEADVVLGGPTGQPVSPKRVGPTLLTSATNKGKFLVRLDAPKLASNAPWSGSIVELNEQFSDDARQVANVEQFRRVLADQDFTPEQTAFVEPLPSNLPQGFKVAGTAACGKCHEDDHRLWRQSKHAAAWKSLEEKGTHVDPECQRCHTTGYGLPGGFSSARKRADRIDVGCESCHGPSQGHVVDPTQHTAHFAQAKDSCTGCHDRENSPTFTYEKYWEQIAHGAAK